MRQFLHTVVIAIIIFTVVLMSEVVYFSKNRPHFFSLGWVYLAQNKIDKNFDGGLKILLRGVNSNIHIVHKRYPNLVPKSYYFNIEPEKLTEGFRNEAAGYIKGVDLTKIAQTEEVELSHILYNLSLLAIKNGSSEVAAEFLQSAVYLSPEFSHYHVELSNFYLFTGDTSKARESIDYCLKFKFPVNHCKEFAQHSIKTLVPETPGFLSKEIQKYYSEVR